MAPDREYSILYNKYNLAILKAKDLQEQIDVKSKQWKKTSEDYSVSEKNMRELCAIILAKDSSQMNNDEKGTWNNYEINDLIRTAIKSYRKYNEERTNLMRKLSDVAEERAFTINELNEEILHLKRHGGTSLEYDEKKENTENKEEKANVSKTSPKFQKAAESGAITVKTAKKIKEDLKEGIATAYYDEEDEEVLEGEKTDDIHKSNMKNNITAKATPHSIQSVHTSKSRIKKKKMREEAIDEVYGEKLKEMVKKMSDDSWEILKIIGESGKSTAKDLKVLGINEFEKKGVSITERGIVAKLSDLANIGVVTKDIVLTPFSGKMTVYNLTSEGSVLYKKKFGREVEISEYDKVIAEHDNLEHGYGILQCGEKIAELKSPDNKKIFEKVNVWNRKNPIKIQSVNGETNLEYIPDIVCIDSNGIETYIEYELNNHKQHSFNSKCSKMFMAGINKINFIVPNKETALELNAKVLKWVESKKNSNNLKYITVRVTTAKSLDELDIRKDENWMFVLYPSKSNEFEVNF